MSAARVLVFGTFDQLHPGHLFVLREAAARGGELFVVVSRDSTTHRIKNRMPVQSEEERRLGVQAAIPRATVLLGDRMDFLNPVRALKPDLILLGYDQKLPPGVRMEDLPCPVERLSAHEAHRFKSSLFRKIAKK